MFLMASFLPDDGQIRNQAALWLSFSGSSGRTGGHVHDAVSCQALPLGEVIKVGKD